MSSQVEPVKLPDENDGCLLVPVNAIVASETEVVKPVAVARERLAIRRAMPLVQWVPKMK